MLECAMSDEKRAWRGTLRVVAAVLLLWLLAAGIVHGQRSEPPSSGWQIHTTDHFRFHVLPNTPAARDLNEISAAAEESLAWMLARLEMRYDGQMEVYLVGRIFWQGGAAFSGKEVLVSYVDRNYIGMPLIHYLDHEFTHILSHTWVTGDAEVPALLAEGVATWATGGHYGPEPIHAMAAALPAMGRYVPIESLLTDFRAHQHEIAYIEAASFVGWLVEQHGLEQVKAFYGAADEPERFFGMDYPALETAWLQWLEQEQDREAVAEAGAWWAAQIRLFDTMRAYQEHLDPFARRLPAAPSGWSAAERRRYLTNVDAPPNVAVETLLIAAGEALTCERNPDAAHALLDRVDAFLSEDEPTTETDAAHLRFATLLTEQEQALQEVGSAALLPFVQVDRWGSPAPGLLHMARLGGVTQEVARLDVRDGQAEALVAWDSLQGEDAGAYTLTFIPDGAGWRLTTIKSAPLPYPLRSDGLCKS